MNELDYRLKIEALRTRIHNLNRELKDLNQRYNELKTRYIKQNEELVSLKIILNKEGYYEDKSRNTKKRTTSNK